MRLTFQMIPLLLLAGLFVSPAIGQDQQEKSQQDDTKQMKMVASNEIVGSYVYGPGDESVGDINSLVLRQDGSVLGAVVGLGGVAGVGETNIIVPWKAIQCRMNTKDDEKSCKFSLPMSAKQLESAPVLEAKNYAEIYDETWMKKNAQFYGQKPGETPEADTCICVDKLTGTELSDKGEDAKDLGSVHALIVNVAKGETPYAIIACGGTLGLGEKYVAVPFGKLNVTCDAEGNCQASASTTAKELTKAPKVTPSDYPELELSSFRDRIAQQFDVNQKR